MRSVAIFSEAASVETPFGTTWSGTAWVETVDGVRRFAAESHGHASPTDAAMTASAGTAARLAAYAATHPIITDQEV